MSVPPTPQKITKIYQTTYAKGCPSNSAGANIGRGLSSKAAKADCQPWNNQAAYVSDRCKVVLAVDGTSQGEEAVWGLLGKDCCSIYSSTTDDEGNKIYTVTERRGLATALKEKRWSDAIAIAQSAQLV